MLHDWRILITLIQDTSDDPSVTTKEAALDHIQTMICGMREENDAYFTNTYMLIRCHTFLLSDYPNMPLCTLQQHELRRIWIEQYGNTECHFETTCQDEEVADEAVVKMLQDERLAVRGKFLMLCAFHGGSRFARRYAREAGRQQGQTWMDWIRSEMRTWVPNWSEERIEEISKERRG